MDLPRGAFQRPPLGYPYRTYPSPPDNQPYDSCRFSTEVKATRTFFARVRDATNRIWVSYHMAFTGPLAEWRRFWFLAPPFLHTTGDLMQNLTECRAYRPWFKHSGEFSKTYTVCYEGRIPYDEAPLTPDLPRAERQIQLRNIANLEKVINDVHNGCGTIEALRHAGNPFQRDTHDRQIPGREPYFKEYIPKACATTAELEVLFMTGFPCG